MGFDVAAESYDRFMGRYSQLLSPQLVDLARVRLGLRVLDVGCGPGALTAELVARLGPGAVAAVDPSALFAAAAQERNPGVDVLRAHLAALFEAAGLRDVEATSLSVTLEHPSFAEWWEPFTRGVGPAGSYVASLDADRQSELRESCRVLLPTGPFVVTALAWAARGFA